MTKAENERAKAAGNAPGSDKTERAAGAKHESPAGVQPVETEDPRQVGGGRAQQHETLKHNVAGGAQGGQGQRHPDTPAGQHATGSFTGDASEKGEAENSAGEKSKK